MNTWTFNPIAEAVLQEREHEVQTLSLAERMRAARRARNREKRADGRHHLAEARRAAWTNLLFQHLCLLSRIS